LQEKTGGAEYYKQGAELLKEDQRRAGEIEKLLIAKLERWEALEAKGKAAAT
jgi:hypothetical protein